MNILIGDTYKLTSDALNVVVHERYEKQKDGQGTGEFDFKAVAYCANIKQAADYLLGRSIRVSDAENLAELVSYMTTIKKDILAAVKDIPKVPPADVVEELRKANKIINDIKRMTIKAGNEARSLEPFEIMDKLNGDDQS